VATKVKKKKRRSTSKRKRRVVHIHMHSIFSIADAMCKPKETAKRAKQLGIDTIILTDHGTISGVIQFKKACEKEGIKFIPACEMYEAEDRTVLKQADCRDWNKARHITMIPVNNKGWADMQFLISDANKYVYYAPKPIPRTDLEFIQEHDLGKNIIATSGCLASKTSQLILDGKYDEAKEEAEKRNNIFHKYYLEIQDNGSREQEIVNQALVQMHNETGIPLVYAKDVHYVKPEDKDAHHALVAIGRKQTVYECAPYSGTNTYHLASADEVYDWADDNSIPHSAIENTCEIADMCYVDIELGKDLMPEYPYAAEGHTPQTYLRKLLYDNLIEYVDFVQKSGYSMDVNEYIERVETEYNVITMKGYPSYFLMLWDILLWATDRDKWLSYTQNKEWIEEQAMDDEGNIDMPNAKYAMYPQFITGPGRGSAAGSMIAYLLDITRLDPIQYGLMFERFLNPYRNSPPDIDVDFPGDNHDMLLDFVAQRYGRDRCAQILTFTKIKLKSGIDKMCRALMKKDDKGKIISYGVKVAEEVKKTLEITGDQGKMPDQKDCTYKDMMEISVHPEDYERYGATLPKFVEASKEFRKLMTKYPELNEGLQRIEGAIDTSGIHAGGVIISNRPINLDCPTTMPTSKSKAVMPITMWDYPDCEDVGLLKMDLLRTATLREISMSLELIKETTGEKIDLYSIGREDSTTFDIISRGQTHGLFQVNGRGITAYTRQVAPIKQEEVIDILALFRPGPLDATLQNGNTIAEQYVLNGKRKAKEYLSDVHPDMREVLKQSRGQMVYQEQIMHLVQIVAGYNLGHADTFRRVIGKKKIDEMPKLYDEFMYGHKYVIKKFKKLLDGYDKAKKHTDEDGYEGIMIKSDYDGKDLFLRKQDIENTIKDNEAAMASHEIVGAVPNGYKKDFAHNLFEQMAAFAGYAFNKSHSACYADETYQTAWLKSNYPVEFMTALLSVRGDKKDKTLENLKEAKRMGIKILPPHINQSIKEFYPEGDGIRFGMLSIDGVGEKAVEAVINERRENGDYKDFGDFIERTVNNFTRTDEQKANPINRAVIRKLIEAGCFDFVEPNRYKLLNYYNFDIRGDKLYDGTEEELAKDSKKSNHSYKYDVTKFNDKLMLEMEHSLIGIYVSGSPYEGLPFTSLQDMDVSRGRRDKTEYDVGGCITKVRTIKTKKGDPMAFVEIETQLEPLEFTVFPDTYEKYSDQLYKNNIIVVRGYKEKSFYRGEEKEQFISSKILVKDAKKLKRQMGINEVKPDEEEVVSDEKKADDLPIMQQSKPEPRKDPVADLFEEEKPKRKKKRKRRKEKDLEEYIV
jgi:DNA polymerase III subunit alpha